MPIDDGNPDLTREQAVQRLAASGVRDVAPYAASLRRTLWMRVSPDREPTPLGSRFGGPAMVPRDFEWPTYVGEPYIGQDPDRAPGSPFTLWYAQAQKLPMHHLAQLNLAEIPVESALPRSGLVSIFYDPFDGPWQDTAVDPPACHLHYTPAEQMDQLVPMDRPPADEHDGAFAEWTWDCYAIDYLTKWMIDRDALSRLAHAETDSDIVERLNDAVTEVCGYSFGLFLLDGGVNHDSDPRPIPVRTFPPRLPDPVSDDDYRRHEEEVTRAAQAWTVLFSIKHTEHLNPVVSDCGGLSILIRKSDLAERRFDRPFVYRS